MPGRSGPTTWKRARCARKAPVPDPRRRGNRSMQRVPRQAPRWRVVARPAEL